MIRIQLIRGNTRDPDRRKRYPSRASCEAVGCRFEATGPAPVYRLATLLWLHGHGGADFEVWDDRSPTGRPGGLAMRGKVRNWARLVKGNPAFVRDAPAEMVFSPDERDLIARAAGSAAKIGSARPENARTAATRPSDGPRHPKGQGDASARVPTAHAPDTGCHACSRR